MPSPAPARTCSSMVKSTIKDLDAFEIEGRERAVSIEFYQWLAAYQKGDFRSARAAYSEAMLSRDAQVRGNSHLGAGQSLFQLGWFSLADDAYPHDAKSAPTLADFDEIVRTKLDELRSGDESAAATDTIKTLITNWADAVRHFDSAHAANPQSHPPASNRSLVMTYLKRLQELLEEDREQTEQSLPDPQQGEGEPQPRKPGEGDPDENGEPQEGEGPQSEGDQGENDEKPKDGSGDDEQESDNKSGDKQEQDENGKSPEDPGESPEERARRILQENADTEKGPLSPGRIEFNPPEKDW
jgi:Ca-activated chloride channel homolog